MNCAVSSTTPILAHYADIATEYYDSERHPTCASLRELSSTFLARYFPVYSGIEENVIEVGAGKSLLAPAWIAIGGEASKLTLIDKSPAMLAYSENWRSVGARLEFGDALSLPFESSTVDILFASLGDPYNVAAFWHEVSRVLRAGGTALFTTPAHEWANCFRDPNHKDTAEFIRRDGSILLMPSFIPSEESQTKMLLNAGLVIEKSVPFYVKDLTSEPAPKLLCTREVIPVLRGYVIRRANSTL